MWMIGSTNQSQYYLTINSYGIKKFQILGLKDKSTLSKLITKRM